MAEILIRGLDDEIVQRLKDRAARNNRSLQAELQIERASMIDPLDARDCRAYPGKTERTPALG